MMTLLLLLACTKAGPDDTAPPPDPYDVAVGPYQVSIRWTAYGIPHVLADDLGSAAFGLGYAMARDHVCVLADEFVKVRSERSRYFGPDHIDQDFGWLHLGVRADAEALWFDLDEPVRDSMVGWAAGYNKRIDEVGPQGLPVDCRGAEWVKPITHIDLQSYYNALAMTGSGFVFVEEIGRAQPPGRRGAHPPHDGPLKFMGPQNMGSNGWALGGELSDSGRGMLLSNTHFPYEGDRRWYESHLTVPGQFNVYGASLLGVSLVNIGFNEHVAWTHTVSSAPRFTMHSLTLQQTNPTAYEHDGAWLDMLETDYEIEVLQADGSLEPLSRTLYSSRFGPIAAVDPLGWNSAMALSLQDANRGNIRMAANWLGMGQAGDLEQFKQAHEEHQGIPWVHTLAADDQGQAWYTDSSVTPNWSAAAEAAYAQLLDQDYITQLFYESGGVLVDGSDPVFDWVDDPRAPAPGILPFEDAPQLQRSDYVLNANDSHWLSNPNETLEGYPLLMRLFAGGERGPRSPRTRVNTKILEGTMSDNHAGEDALWSVAELQQAALSSQGLLASQLKQAVYDRCAAQPTVELRWNDEQRVADLSEACPVLDSWDGQMTADSRGAVLWREFLGNGLFEYEDFLDAGRLYLEPFDANDPLETPHGLAPASSSDDDRVLNALGRAVLMLEDAGIAPDASLGELQFHQKGEAREFVPGGNWTEGAVAIAAWSGGASSALVPTATRGEVFNSITDLTAEGYPVNYGNSWVMTMQFTDDGPVAEAAMVYSQSADPESPHYNDQGALYGDQSLRPVLFTEADILADPELVVQDLSLPAE